MSNALIIGSGVFLGMIGTAFVLRREIRRAPEVPNEPPADERRALLLRGDPEPRAARIARLENRLRDEERRQRPGEGRN